MDGWSLRAGERKWTGEEPMSSTPALLLQQCKGNEGSKEGCSPHREVTLWWHHRNRQGPTSFCRAELCSPQHSTWTLQESSVWDGACCGESECERFRECQEALWGRHHRTLAALSSSGNPFGAICWKLEEYLNGKMTLFSSMSNMLSLSISYQAENYYWGKWASSLIWCT